MSVDTNMAEMTTNFDYVSFDIFDTLVFRTVTGPKNVFDIVEAILKEQGYNIKNFAKKRIQAERKTRWSNKGREICISDIYDNIEIPNVSKNVAMQIEKDCEVNLCIGNQMMLSVLNKCLADGKKIVITTDMYLDRLTIQRILKKVGVSYHYLYISGEVGVTKRSGKLFEHVLKDLNIDSSLIVHLGDDQNNDIIQPQQKGITSYERLCNNHATPIYSLKSNSCNNVSNNLYYLIYSIYKGCRQLTPAMRVGTEALGPMVVDFCQWINKQKKKKCLDRLYFVAREGYLIYNIYLTLYPAEKESCYYIKLNRNLLEIKYGNHEEQLLLLKEYLNNYEITTGRIGLINNSINGTGQKLLEEYLQENGYETKVYGLQFIKSAKCENRLGKRAYAWITDSCLPKMFSKDMKNACFVLEHLMFEPSGTALCFSKDNDTIVIKTEAQHNEKYNNDTVESIQQYALDFARKFQSCNMHELNFTGLRNFCRFTKHPVLEDAKLVGSLWDDDIDGNTLLADDSIPFSPKMILSYGIPKVIRWKQGYFVLKYINNFWINIYNMKNICSFYLKGRKI